MNAADGVPLLLIGSPRGARSQRRQRGAPISSPRCGQPPGADRRRPPPREASKRFAATSTGSSRSRAERCAPELAEVQGIAQAFGLDPRTVFDGLHASAIADLAAADGCTAWAAGGSEGALLAKNRDIRADLWALQAVMLHVDADHPMRAVLCVGSLGAPGAYSSGMNRGGPGGGGHGHPRRLVCDRLAALLRHDPTALGVRQRRRSARLPPLSAAHRRRQPRARRPPRQHRGGRIRRRSPGGRAGGTRDAHQPLRRAAMPHPLPAPRTRTRPVRQNGCASCGRPSKPKALRRPRLPPARIMAAHAGDDAALCRHGDGDRVRTVSTAIFMTQTRELLFAPDYPCLGRWLRFSLAAYDD